MTRHLAARLVLAAGLLVAPVALAASGQDAPQLSAAPPAQGASPAQGGSAVGHAAASTARKAHVKMRRSRLHHHPVRRVTRGYGFLPGYEPPPVDRRGSPVDGPSEAYQYSRGGRYWYRGRWYYGFGGPGFYRGRWNGGSFGPCWTETPIGPMWNCGR